MKTFDFPKFFGKMMVGPKGQIVIPIEARKEMNIKPGDRVIIISGPPVHGRSISIIPEKDFSRFLKLYEKHLDNLKDKF